MLEIAKAVIMAIALFITLGVLTYKNEKEFKQPKK